MITIIFIVGAFACGVIFGDKIKAYAQAQIDNIKAKL